MDNSRLRDDLARTRDELSAAKKKLPSGLQADENERSFRGATT